jgi:hypothetical protein
MKNILITIFILTSVTMFAQNNINEQLSKLFLNLDLALPPRTMVTKSTLKFEQGRNQGIGWGKTSNSTDTFITEFDKNPLIESRIRRGKITIIQKDEEVRAGVFSINERIWFHSSEDMMNEYYKICFSFEKLGYRVKNTIVENDNFETKNETTEIRMESDSKKSSLTIGYTLPPEDEENKEYFLAIIYTNQ